MARIPLSDAVAVGVEVTIGKTTTRFATVFVPVRSNARLFSRGNDVLLGPLDEPGDYIVNSSSSGQLRRWRAITFPTATAGRDPVLFADSFSAGGFANADGDFSWWSPPSAAAGDGCTFAEEVGRRGLVVSSAAGRIAPCVLSSPSSAARSATRGVANFFAQPTRFSLGGVLVGGGGEASSLLMRLRPVIGTTASSRSSSLAIRIAGHSLHIVSSTGGSSPPHTCISLQLPHRNCCRGAIRGCSVAITVGVRNVTAELIRCGAPSPQCGGRRCPRPSRTPTPTG